MVLAGGVFFLRGLPRLLITIYSEYFDSLTIRGPKAGLLLWLPSIKVGCNRSIRFSPIHFSKDFMQQQQTQMLRLGQQMTTKALNRTSEHAPLPTGFILLDRPVRFSLLLLWCFCFELYENVVLKKRCKPNTRLNGRSNPLELGKLAMRDGAKPSLGEVHLLSTSTNTLAL